jgi:drug/metabolite transporter (DMT)-like permease
MLKSDKSIGFLLVAFAGTLFGLIVFGGKIFADMGLSLFEIAVFPYAIVTLILFPFILLRGAGVLKKDLPILLFYGFVTAITIILQFAGVVFGASVAVVVLLLYAQPLWTILISKFFLKEKVSFFQIIAGGLVLIGVFFLIDPSNLFASKSFLGVLSALIGGVFLSLWVITGGIVSKRRLPPVSILFFEVLFSVIFCICFYPILLVLANSPEIVSFSLGHSLQTFVLLFCFSVFSVLLPHLLYYVGVKKIPIVSAGIILLLEPIVGVVLSVLFLSQPLTISVVFGGALILLGNVIVILKS